MEDKLADGILAEMRAIREELSRIVAAIARIDQSIMSFKDGPPLPEKSSVDPSHD